jgi:surface polysaccharide O-acyltransferase-like enzyme
MYNNLDPAVIVMSLALFRFFTSAPRAPKLMTALAPLTLGVYVLHPFVLHHLHGQGLNGLTGGPFVGIPATTLAAVILSAGLTWVLKKTPVLRKTV